MKNTQSYYGWLTIVLHWLSAIIIIGLFSLGLWMVDLGYYHSWRKAGPELHQSIGLTLLMIMVIRLVWRFIQISPQPLTSYKRYEIQAAKIVHALLYLLIFLIMISGYLFSTAEGEGIVYFNQFIIPGLGAIMENQEDLMGYFHQYAAYLLIFVVVLHAIAALKHHFIDKDATLLRMFGKRT